MSLDFKPPVDDRNGRGKHGDVRKKALEDAILIDLHDILLFLYDERPGVGMSVLTWLKGKQKDYESNSLEAEAKVIADAITYITEIREHIEHVHTNFCLLQDKEVP